MKNPGKLLAVWTLAALVAASALAQSGEDLLVVVLYDRSGVVTGSSQYDEEDVWQQRTEAVDALLEHLRSTPEAGAGKAHFAVYLSGWRKAAYDALIHTEDRLGGEELITTLYSLIEPTAEGPLEADGLPELEAHLNGLARTFSSGDFRRSVASRDLEPALSLVNLQQDGFLDRNPGRIEIYTIRSKGYWATGGEADLSMESLYGAELPDLAALTRYLQKEEVASFGSTSAGIALDGYHVVLPTRPQLTFAARTIERESEDLRLFRFGEWKGAAEPAFKIGGSAVTWKSSRVVSWLQDEEISSGTWAPIVENQVYFDPMVAQLAQSAEDGGSVIAKYRVMLRGTIRIRTSIVEEILVPVELSYEVPFSISFDEPSFLDRYGQWLLVLLTIVVTAICYVLLKVRSRNKAEETRRLRVAKVETVANKLIQLGPGVYLDDSVLRHRSSGAALRPVNTLTEEPVVDSTPFTVSFPLYVDGKDDDVLAFHYNIAPACDSNFVEISRQERQTDRSVDLELTLRLLPTFDETGREHETIRLQFVTRLDFESQLTGHQGRRKHRYELRLNLYPIL